MIIFVTGTDTGVGKTRVACELVRELINCGVDVAVCKPVESGVVGNGETDAGLLLAAQGGTQQEAVCLYRLRAALAPAVAARLEGLQLETATVVTHIRALAQAHSIVVVEGAGGLLVPLADNWTLLDLAAECGGSFLLVVKSRLGAINHTALTLDALRSHGAAVLGYVLNNVEQEEGGSAELYQTNRETIRQIAANYEAPELGYLPYLAADAAPSLEALTAAILLRLAGG